MGIKSKEMDMVNGPFFKNLFVFSLPLAIANLLQIAFNAADTIIVGKYSGKLALAAVGATGSIINLIVSFMTGIALGVNIVIARQIGANKKDKIKHSVGTSIYISLIGGILVTIIGIISSKYLLTLLATPSDIIDLATTYMRIYFISAVFIFIYDVCAAILRSVGETTKPTIYLLISGVFNVLLNVVLVVFLNMGVSGVAWATVISQIISAILVFIELLKSDKDIKLDLSLVKFDKEIVKEELKIGVPSGIQSAMWALSNMAIQFALNSFDNSAIIAGNTASGNIENFVYVGTAALSSATITFTSQNAGAGQKDNIKKIMLNISWVIILVSLPICILLNVFGTQFLSFYNSDPIVIEYGLVRLRYVTFWLFLNALLDVPACSMRGMGRSMLPTVLMICGIVVVRIIYIFTIFTLNPTLEALYLVYPISWVITLILCYSFWVAVYNRFQQ